MDTNELKNICLQGSKTYYHFLDTRPNRGVEEININSIDRVDDNTYKLTIDRKVFEIDSICFSYNGDYDALFNSDKISIKVYDNDKRVLIIKVSHDIIPIISDLDNTKWKIVIDLKFLVQRVIDWYQANGNKLEFHFQKRIDSFDRSIFLESSAPSDEQKQAISTIFSENLSYIWGAPGTGKTRFVLSYSILHYINKKLKVLVLAPTNVALEQILSGVIEVLIKAGIDYKKILRLGYPSREFAEKYGDICEIQGLEKELKRINEQIGIISEILGLKTEKEITLEEKLNQIKQSIELQDQLTQTGALINDTKNQISKFENALKQLDLQKKSIEDERKYLIKKKNSVIVKIFHSISRKIDFDRDINELIRKEVKINNVVNDNIKQIEKCNNENNFRIQTYKNLRKEVNEKLLAMKQEGVITELTPMSLQIALKSFTENLQKEIDNKKVYKALSKEYDNHNETELKKLLQELFLQREKLENHSLETRIEESLVIGSTIDTYLFRFKERNINIAHIFIDEAGYASVVKTLTVFTRNTPITFLGDHMQLQPICELSKSDIKKNSDYHDVFVWDQSAIFIGEIWKCQNKEKALENYFTLNTPSRESIPRSSLTYSYRFGPNVARTLAEYVYITDGFKSKLRENTEVILCNVNNPIAARTGNRKNEAEAQSIKKFIKENFNDKESIAILSPYKDQIKRLKELLPEFKDENLILTVHKSQGREWDTVIFSVCDIGNGKKPWFTDTQNRISNGLNNVNTAVSRAKKRLIIFCNKQDWINQENQLITGLLQSCTQEINFNTDDIQFSNNHKDKNEKKSFRSHYRSRNLGDIKGKDYVPTAFDEQWESLTLYWSKKKLDGYKYSSKKDAWWKKK